MPWSLIADVWAVGTPSWLGVVGGAGALTLALLVMGRLATDVADAEPPVGVLGTLAQIRALRAEVQRRLEASPAARRAVLEHLLVPALDDFDRQVAQRERDAALHAPDVARHAATRAELGARLEAERDPRARQLLEASLADLAHVEQADAEFAQRIHVAELELVRLRSLLERLATQLDGFERSPSQASWEATLVAQFEQALHATRDVLEA
ncbi:MAG: hypothetical protein KDD82_30055 [Planctomycetes bacterium]|nr:hypothetical protein [Planctomycetota bacterium]